MRTNNEINISRFTNNAWSGAPQGLVNVPITPASRRKFHLMTEDSITLSFSLATSLDLMVGDFIMDEIFGLFVLREKQLPTYNKATGGYDYNLRFDRAYWLWENHILMLTAPTNDATQSGTITRTIQGESVILSASSADGSYKRMESVWCLTSALDGHAEQVLANLLAANLTYFNMTYRVRILSSATRAKEVRFISYDSKHICSALNEIAEAFECEWWVSYETVGNQTYGYLNFGRCQTGIDILNPIEFKLGINCESMTASRDLTNYANRIYMFGGTDNVPESYRKKLILNVDTEEIVGGVRMFMDSDRAVNPYTMLLDEGTAGAEPEFRFPQISQPDVVSSSTPGDNEIVNDTATAQYPGRSVIKYRAVALRTTDSNVKTFGFKNDVEVRYTSFTAGLVFALSAKSNSRVEAEFRLFFENVDDTTDKIYISDNPYKYIGYTSNTESSTKVDGFTCPEFAKSGTKIIKGGKTYKLVLEATIAFRDTQVSFINDSSVDYTLTNDFYCALFLPAGKSFAAEVVFNNTTYPVTFNPLKLVEGEDYFNMFKFDGSVPSGFMPTGGTALYDAEVEYLESTGTQYIDTGINPQIAPNAVVDLTMLNADDRDYWGNSLAGTAAYVVDIKDYILRYYRYASNSSAANSGTIGEGRHVIEVGKEVYVDGTLTFTSSNTFVPNLTLSSIKIFGSNRSTNRAVFRLHSFKLYDGDNLVRDYIPVRVGTTGYLYDKVSGTLFGNAGSGSFALGNDVITDNRLELKEYRADMIPNSWYTDDSDDPSSLIGLGDRRLRLPASTNGYVETSGLLEVQRVETTVKNDNIYPKCYLRVSSVREETGKIDKIEYSDGTSYEWEWTAYVLELELLDGSEFPFEYRYVKEGEKLYASFINDYEETEAYYPDTPPTHDGYLLAGMKFEVAFRGGFLNRTYTLIRNEEYGAKLPSSKLKPSVGDVLVLTGWNVGAMEDLGLVAEAETKLQTFANDYLDAMQSDGWNFRCEMMSDEDESPLEEGTSVKVWHNGLKNGYKQSRVIGYEFKLDFPHDTPIYEVGETDAYSRIKQLERQIQKI